MIHCNECWTDDDDTDHAPDCSQRVNVNCDQNCGALLQPQTLADAIAAIEHWQHHQYLHGCSHGR